MEVRITTRWSNELVDPGTLQPTGGYVADICVSWGTECKMTTTTGSTEEEATGRALTEVRKIINRMGEYETRRAGN